MGMQRGTLPAEPFLTVHMLCSVSSAKKKAIKEALLAGWQRGYDQTGPWSTATRGGGRVAKDDCLCGVQDEKTTLQATANFNSKWRKALLTLLARAKTEECDGVTACFAMS